MSFFYLSALIQGISEAFPISSSAHMIAARLFFPSLYAQELSIFSKAEMQLLDIGLHLGTLITIAIYFRKDIREAIESALFTLTRGRFFSHANKTLFTTLFCASLPAVFCGALFSFLKWDQISRAPIWIAINCALFGLLLGLSQSSRFLYKKKSAEKEEWPSLLPGFFIGCAQVLALFPGVSRLGICTTAACFLCFSTWRSIRFSFLLGFISISGALFLKGITAPQHFFINLDPVLFIKALCLSIIVNLFCLHGLKIIIHRWGLWPFSFYRIGLGVFLMVLVAL